MTNMSQDPERTKRDGGEAEALAAIREATEVLRGSDLPQIQMFAVRVEALASSLIASVVAGVGQDGQSPV